MATRWGWFALALPALLAACASAPADRSEEPPGAPIEERVPVVEIADWYHLGVAYDDRRNRVDLAGPAGRVTLFPRTTVALVNGERISGMGRVEGAEGAWTVSKSDAARIRGAFRRRQAYRPSPTPPPAPVRTPDPPADPPKAKRVAYPATWRVPLGRSWRYIVIHHSGTASGDAASFHRHHVRAKGWDGLGYHFVIGNGRGSGDGQVEVGYRWTRQLTGAHAGRGRSGSNHMNETGIGIALVGNFNKSRPTPAQIESLERLVCFLRETCRIPANRVLLHRDVRGTDCPGRNFPVRLFLVPGRDIPPAFR
jgi:hypothetical protein